MKNMKINRTKPLTVPEINELLNTIRRPIISEPYHNPHQSVKLSVRMVSLKIEEASKQMEDIFNFIGKGGNLPLKEIKEDILPTIIQAAEIPHLYHLFYELNSKDQYTYRHTICVGIISTIIGKWMKMSPDELAELALGASLHDIGKSRVAPEILNKPGKLSKEEYEEMKLHTVIGYDLLKSVPGINERVARVALQHHEREDGKGYPFKLLGPQIDRYSKIVAIADVFHAMSSTRIYHEAEPLYSVVKQMQSDTFGKFDPQIMLFFLYKLMDNLTGKKVLLSDGTVGTIVMIHPYDPLKSLVKVEDVLIDLRFNDNLQIEKVIDDER